MAVWEGAAKAAGDSEDLAVGAEKVGAGKGAVVLEVGYCMDINWPGWKLGYK